MASLRPPAPLLARGKVPMGPPDLTSETSPVPLGWAPPDHSMWCAPFPTLKPTTVTRGCCLWSGGACSWACGLCGGLRATLCDDSCGVQGTPRPTSQGLFHHELHGDGSASSAAPRRAETHMRVWPVLCLWGDVVTGHPTGLGRTCFSLLITFPEMWVWGLRQHHSRSRRTWRPDLSMGQAPGRVCEGPCKVVSSSSWGV